MKKIVVVIVVLLAAAFIYFGVAELQSIRATLKSASPMFLVLAFLIGCVCLFNTSAAFGALYRLAGLTESQGPMFLMTSAAAFVNLIAPTSGVGGLAVFMDSARRRNSSTARVLVAGLLYLVYEYASLFCLLLTGFFVLAGRGILNAGEIIAAGFLLAVAAL
jgi:uncharacterized membrane protein YbhN (UPF0104 family)